MVKKKKHDKDKWYHLAKEQGYRSRAAFKLIQLNRKFDFLSSARAVIDLCAAPGGWLQVAAKYMPVSSVLVGVDLLPIRPIRNVITLKEDITTQKCKHELKKCFKGWKVDVVLHDGAPNLGQAWAQDAYGQATLTLSALALATDFLMEDGTFVSKVFRSTDYNSLLWVFNQLFKKVTATKPPSSRNTSAEIFVVCQGYLAPKHLDPRFLDPKHVFKELDAPAQSSGMAVDQLLKMGTGKKIRNRGGYEDGITVLFKTCPVSRFIEEDRPVEQLAAMNVLSFEDEESKKYADDKLTSDEIKFCCSDLKVLSKKDIKNLLKWRLKMRTRHMKDEKKETEEKEEPSDGEESVDDEEAMDREIAERVKAERDRKKRLLKKERAKKKKAQHRVDLKMDLVNDVVDAPEDLDLFALSQIKSKRQLEAVHDGEEIDDLEITAAGYSDDDSENDSADEFLASDSERVADMDRMLEDQYSQYLERAKRKQPRLKIGKKEKKRDVDMFDAFAQWKKEQEAKLTPAAAAYNSDSDEGDEEDVMSDGEEHGAEENPLIVRDSSGAPVSSSQRAQQWFDQEMFAGVSPSLALSGGGLDSSDESEGESAKEENRRESLSAIDLDHSDAKSDSDEEMAEAGAERDSDSDSSDGFETVPMMKYRESDSDSDESDMDDKERAELLALGTLVKTGKMKWSDVIEKGYNRYTFDETDVPSWFQHDEERHNKPQMPVTKEMVDQILAKQREINARPPKKIAEAKARKKLKMHRKMEKVKRQATAISQDKDMSDVGKMRAMEKLYKGQMRKMKPSRVYVVRRKFQKGTGRVSNAPQTSGNQKIKVVDKRQKSDKRGLERAARRKKKHIRRK
mmetsp:Transcript_8139/g.34217  ORF Transcript_8139/g.34217 Transcript_8139/m.34217 type:complete len:850 (+) Transcript_8139:53-2602(+)